MILPRRSFLTGLIAAPVVLKADALMSISDPKVNGIRFLSSYGPIYDKLVGWYQDEPNYLVYINVTGLIKVAPKHNISGVPTKLSDYRNTISYQREFGYKDWKIL